MTGFKFIPVGELLALEEAKAAICARVRQVTSREDLEDLLDALVTEYVIQPLVDEMDREERGE